MFHTLHFIDYMEKEFRKKGAILVVHPAFSVIVPILIFFFKNLVDWHLEAAMSNMLLHYKKKCQSPTHTASTSHHKKGSFRSP